LLLNIISFELRYHLRQPGFYLSLAALAGLGACLAYVGTNGPGGGGVRPVNEAFNVAAMITLMTLIGAFVPLSNSADIVRRDAANGMADLVHATPAPDWIILLGRFIVAIAATSAAFLAAASTFEVMGHMPWVDAKLVGPFQPGVYGRVFVLLVLPTLFCFAALSVLVTSLSRSAYSTFLLLIAIYLLFVTSQIAFKRLGSQTVLNLLDPSAYSALAVVTRHWTNIERATLRLPIEGPLLMNRSIWSAVGFICLISACALAARRDGSNWFTHKRVPATVTLPAASQLSAPVSRIDADTARSAFSLPRPIVATAAASLADSLLLRLRFELAGLLRSWVSIALLILPAVIALPLLYFADSSDGLALLPVTSSVAPKLSEAAVIPMVLFCVLFAGEMVWRERNARMSEIIDATITPGLVYLSTKLAALTLIVAIQLAILTAIGISYQLYHGAPQINLSYYAAVLVVDLGWPLVLISVVAMLVHALIPGRSLGHVATLCIVAGLSSVELFGIEHRLLNFADAPSVSLSDMNGVGHYLKAPLWLFSYWTCIAVILLLLADLLRERIAGTPLTTRVRGLRQIRRPVVLAGTGALLLATAMGGFIIWNFHFLNDYTTKASQEKNSVEFERAYGPLLDAPQPRVIAIEVAVDLFPEQRSYKVRGQMTLKNTTAQPISTFHVNANSDYFRLSIAEPADIERPSRRSCCNVHIVKLAKPMQPGEQRALSFTAAVTNPGFRNSPDTSGIRYNGTFLNQNELVPTIGFSKNLFLQDERRRLAFGLQPIDDTPAPGDTRPWRRNYINQDADYVDLEITVSTSPDQIAIAPGYLQREWFENGRRHFRYEMDRKIVNFWSVVSARYAVTRDRWNDVELDVYYHPAHGANVVAMIEAIKLTLTYATQAFGPYQYRQMRIVEFPYGGFAQSFPNTLPISENAGFITDPRAGSGFAYGVTNITAHEVAHQWWGHQVISADVPGATFLSETLAEYTMLMVVQRRYGAERVRDLIRRDVDTYLKSRGKGARERPLARVKLGQPEIAYQKGGAAMYALQWAIGETTVNRALARLVREYAEKSDPYASAADLVRLLKEEAGPEHSELISDLFERITLWDFAALKATADKIDDGKWKVRLQLRARKLEADENGTETERPLDQSIQFAFFKDDPATAGMGQRNRIGLFRQRVQTGTQWLEMTVDLKPAFVAINPFFALVQRNTTLNVIAVGS
jgi:ABC-type transport system involved in multi-copper enzyme maturation permease subunit